MVQIMTNEEVPLSSGGETNHNTKSNSTHIQRRGGRGRGRGYGRGRGRGRGISHKGRGRGRASSEQRGTSGETANTSTNDEPRKLLDADLEQIMEQTVIDTPDISDDSHNNRQKTSKKMKSKRKGIRKASLPQTVVNEQVSSKNKEVVEEEEKSVPTLPSNPNPASTTSEFNHSKLIIPMHMTKMGSRVNSITSFQSESSMGSHHLERDAQVGHITRLHLNTNMEPNVTSTSINRKTRKNASKKQLLAHSTDKKPNSESVLEMKKKKKSSKTESTEHGKKLKNAKALKAFNAAVRKCVEQSDPQSLYTLLHDKKNHEYSLYPDTLETVLQAHVVAAMFDEALYCLRNCSSPGTLSVSQTERILSCLPQNMRNSSAFVAADMINALCISTKFEESNHRSYFMRIVRGIALEFLEEVTSARDRICTQHCERLVRSQLCVVNAKIQKGRKGNELVVIPGYQLGVFIPDTVENRGIQAGDAVGILPYAGPYPMSAESLDRNMVEATVTGLNPMTLRLQDRNNTSLHDMLTEDVEGNVYRIDRLANRMGFNRQLSAAVVITSPFDPNLADLRRPSPELIKAITAMDENINRNFSRGIKFTGELTSTAAICAQAVPFQSSEEVFDEYGECANHDQDSIRDAARLLLDKYDSLRGLNASQMLAVEGATTNRLSLVQGPPGSGKTAVAIRIIEHWARIASNECRDDQNPKPILATSDSNIAVDNLVEGCANIGLKVVRLGRPEAVRPELLRFCIDRPQHTKNVREGSQSYMSHRQEKLNLLKNAQVICCTCIGSGSDILESMSFERVLVDEATQATEPAILVPLTRSCRQLVLVGDHCQLPPTVLSTKASEEGLGVPLFSRMVACGVPPFMLDTQYRMHPAIAMFPSDLFYGGKLISGVTAPERRPIAGFPWPREEFPVAFLPVNHGIELDDGVSKYNEAEAHAACEAVEMLLSGGQCSPSDIAVVTPYAAQVRLIRRLTKKLNTDSSYIEVSSTDGFQGREKEAVVFSAVRSNDYSSVGFVSDWRRVNVSFTRARRGLIVIGNEITLRTGDPETWMPWLQWADAHGINMDKPGIPRGRYDPDQLRRVRGGTTAAEMLKDVLARQQAQVKTAEHQLEKASKKRSGQLHVAGEDLNGNVLSTQEALNQTGNDLDYDLNLLSNTSGCWDDSDDEDEHMDDMIRVSSIPNIESEEKEILDAWDL
jgi:hypothetical protein